MSWNVIRNSEPTTRIDEFYGTCPKYNKKAKITVNLVGIKQCKTDLQKTYHKAGCSCSLLTTESNSSFCIENCPLIPDKF